MDGSDGYLHSHQTSLGRSFLPLSVSKSSTDEAVFSVRFCLEKKSRSKLRVLVILGFRSLKIQLREKIHL